MHNVTRSRHSEISDSRGENIKTSRKFPWTVCLLCLFRFAESGILFMCETSQYSMWVDGSKTVKYSIKRSNQYSFNSRYNWLLPVLSLTIYSEPYYILVSTIFTLGLLASVLFTYSRTKNKNFTSEKVSNESKKDQINLIAIGVTIIGLCLVGMDLVSQIPEALNSTHLLLIHVSYSDAICFLLIFSVIQGIQLLLLCKGIRFQKHVLGNEVT